MLIANSFAYRHSLRGLSVDAQLRNATHSAATTPNTWTECASSLATPPQIGPPEPRPEFFSVEFRDVYTRAFNNPAIDVAVEAQEQRFKMATRPTFIDLRSQSHGPFTSGPLTSRGLPSPRLHVAGDIAPELSPLDAFAAQSRMLAKQLDDSIKSGKRVSRLPPLTIANSLNHGRPNYFRSASAEVVASPNTSSSPTNTSCSALKPEIETPGFRPVSTHPRFSGAPSTPSQPLPRLSTYQEEYSRGRSPGGPATSRGSYGGWTEQSPTSLEQDQMSIRSETFRPRLNSQQSMDSLSQRASAFRSTHDRAYAVGGYDSNALAPPQAPFAQRSSSPRSMSNDSSDDDFSASNARSILLQERSQSSQEGLSISPLSTSIHSVFRSPSISSEISAGGTSLPRPAFNFSRPLSRASTSGLLTETPSRQASSDSQPSFVLVDDSAHTPVSIDNEHADKFPDFNAPQNSAAPSYVYSRFTLPRGKPLQRNSIIFQEELGSTKFPWEQQTPATSENGSSHVEAPPSPPLRPSTSVGTAKPFLDTTASFLDSSRSSQDKTTNERRPSDKRLRPSTSHENHGASQPASSASTIKAISQHSTLTSDMSAEEHVDLGIEAHEAGALNKSTYHLRLAARQNHPTGMLLYALACRHGWGMRSNQKEGVAWLRKAAESASLEVADDEELLNDGKPVDVVERKTRKAQFALSIYELGVSHMNGWGIEQDKALALRCFEIAGSWGDADALAEAGFCYAQGIGCKKDLKKSAKFYRDAESKGISMIGNSWIYKSKYNDFPEAKEEHSAEQSSPKKRKPRNKSRTRTMFGRMKSY